MAVTAACVAVEQTAYHFDKPYSYLVPDSLSAVAVPGMRVLVPFGAGNRSRQGVILSLCDAPSGERLKPILKALDDFPALGAEQMRLVAFVKEHTFCTLFDAARLMYPTGLNYRIVPKYSAISPQKPEKTFSAANETEKSVLDVLAASKKPLDFSSLHLMTSISCDEKQLEKALQNLVKKGLVNRLEYDRRTIGDKTMRTVSLSPDFFEPDGTPRSDMKQTPRQREITRLLGEIGCATVKEICYFTGISEAVVLNLVKKGLLCLFEQEVLRTPGEVPDGHREPIELNITQQKAYTALKARCSGEKGSASLLFGVTGSGKTKVYIKLIDDVLDSGRTVIVTVPEIALTPQTLSIFRSRYGRAVAIMHSGLSMGERLDEWKRIKNKEAKIVVGTRSAVFAPLENIGLIVMDEEQEHSYKSESTPRYHARDVLRFRAAYNKALLLLCSATPSVESYMKAKSGVYSLVELPERYGDAVLPEVITCDMKKELQSGNDSGISALLEEKLTEVLSDKKQAILLLNRRGYNTFIACRECGSVLSCESCSISMVYHRDNDRVMCHYCGRSEKRPESCPKCGGEFMRYSGAGTQRAEEQLRAIFPEARILRMDADTTMRKDAHRQKLDAFSAGEYDILIGTQMVAKGLDFPNVTLVGILDADGIFYNSDFRSYERAFSMLTQVIGRAGRAGGAGAAVIQTTTPENELIRLACTQDYISFFEEEIALRRLMEYPPYCDICVVGFTSASQSAAFAAANRFLMYLKRLMAGEYKDVRVKIMGPSPAGIVMINARYRYKLIIKCRSTSRFRAMLSNALDACTEDKLNKNTAIFADINPMSIM